jgi:hypothetical protein
LPYGNAFGIVQLGRLARGVQPVLEVRPVPAHADDDVQIVGTDGGAVVLPRIDRDLEHVVITAIGDEEIAGRVDGYGHRVVDLR